MKLEQGIRSLLDQELDTDPAARRQLMKKPVSCPESTA